MTGVVAACAHGYLRTAAAAGVALTPPPKTVKTGRNKGRVKGDGGGSVEYAKDALFTAWIILVRSPLCSEDFRAI